MFLAAIAIAIALPVALLTGGSLRRIAETRFRWLPLLFFALVVQLALEYGAPSWLARTTAQWILIATFGAVAVFLAVNHHLPGALIAVVGLILNVSVISLNGAMPVRVPSDRHTSIERLDHGTLKHEPMTDDTVMPWLGDALPVPGLRAIVSPGDLVLGVGVAWMILRRAHSDREG